MARLLDAHCHLHEYSDDEISEFVEKLGIAIIAVSDDLESSNRTLELSKRFSRIIPALGMHPWEVSPERLDEVEAVIQLVYRNRDVVRMLGEIGLDRRFRGSTIAYQYEVFTKFLEVARELQLGVTVHSVDTWDEVLRLLQRYDIPIAVFHWYTGPLDLIKEIGNAGYMISINPAISVQEKHRRVASIAPLEMILVESDGPYNYRGMRLGPHMLEETVRHIAEAKKMSVDEVRSAIIENGMKLVKALRISIDVLV